jgi:methylated-DNA-protein-cysteine methyltransferase-like protein
MSKRTFYDQVYDVVRRIPAGRVTTYGRIANMLGRPNAARAVGYALAALGSETSPHDDVPWQRVVNSQGRISIVNREYTANEQAERLRGEGVPVDEQLRLDLDRYLWSGLDLPEIDAIIAGET